MRLDTLKRISLMTVTMQGRRMLIRRASQTTLSKIGRHRAAKVLHHECQRYIASLLILLHDTDLVPELTDRLGRHRAQSLVPCERQLQWYAFHHSSRKVLDPILEVSAEQSSIVRNSTAENLCELRSVDHCSEVMPSLSHRALIRLLTFHIRQPALNRRPPAIPRC